MRCPHCEFEEDAPTARFCGGCGGALVTVVAAPHARFGCPDTYTPSHLAERILTSKTALEGERKHVTVLFAGERHRRAARARVGGTAQNSKQRRAISSFAINSSCVPTFCSMRSTEMLPPYPDETADGVGDEIGDLVAPLRRCSPDRRVEEATRDPPATAPAAGTPQRCGALNALVGAHLIHHQILAALGGRKVEQHT